MKKFTVYVFVVFISASFTSCMKTYTCACNITWAPGHNMGEPSTYEEHEIKAFTKKNARLACDALTDEGSIYMQERCAIK